LLRSVTPSIGFEPATYSSQIQRYKLTRCATYANPYREAIIFCRCGFFYFRSFFFPRLFSAVADSISTTLPHMMASKCKVRMHAGLRCAARGLLQIQDAKKSPKIAIWAQSNNFVGLYLSQLRHVGYRQSEKKLLNSNISPTSLHNMVNFGPRPITAEIGWRVWGTPANFKGFRVFGFVTAQTSLTGSTAFNIKRHL